MFFILGYNQFLEKGTIDLNYLKNNLTKFEKFNPNNIFIKY